jgi:hypothetical protein
LVGWFLKRDTDDKMAKLLKDYNLSLLRPPSELEAVGNLHVYAGGKTSTQGRINYLLDPPLEMPPIISDESLPDFSGAILSAVSFDEGFSWFEGFLNAFKIAGISSKLKLNYEQKKAKNIKFRFSDVTQDRVDVFELGAKLEDPKFRVKNPFYDGKSQYYLVTTVARSPSISISVEDEGGKALSLGLDFQILLDNSTGVDVKESSENEMVVRGKKLAFGIQTYEMRYDPRLQKLSFIPAGVIPCGTKGKPDLKPALIGGSKGNVFVDLETPQEFSAFR